MQEFLAFKEMLAIAPQINYAFALAAVVEREDWDGKTLGEDVWPSMWLKNVTPLCHASLKRVTYCNFDQFHC